MMVARTVIHHLLVALPVVCLFAATLTTAFNQNDEDLIFDDEGVVRARREVEVAPVAEPLQDSSNIHSHSGRQRRQLFSNPFGSTSDDEDDEGSAIEGSGMEPRVYRVMFTLEKRWTQAYRNREGPAYRNTKAQISSAFTELLQDVQGNPNLQVVAMTKSPSSEIRLTVDITYDWEPERSNEIKMKIENALRSGFVGSHRVRKQRFSIDEHKDPAEGCRGDDSFLCNDDVTIICEVQRCDGSVDCPDGDDEEGCDPAEGCRGDDSFVCVEGTIICEVQRCDGSEDCPEGDDEEGCDCSEDEFTCDHERCIPKEKMCDMIQDCMDKKDEENCFTTAAPPPIPSCRSDDQGPRQCNDGVSYACYCDGHEECPGREDEDPQTCGTSGCEPGELLCDFGTRCVQSSQLCDGTRQCLDGLDEQDCTPTPVVCPSDQFACNDGTCIEGFRHCDFAVDCRYGEDETSCACEPPNFMCNSGMCISPDKRCDGTQDCDDGTDETVNCPCNDKFTCDDGQCVEQTLRCDGTPDCRDGSDEKNCPECEGSGMFECDNGDTCLSDEKLCDGFKDCSDGYDEYDCSGQMCPQGKFMCDDGNCIETAYRCDGTNQCLDQSDESGCPCGEGEWTCLDGSCVPSEVVCDRNPDCIDRSDEGNCSIDVVCRPNEWTCRDGSCVAERNVCDGQYDCPDNSDEEECHIKPCGPGEWTCVDGSCIPQSHHCNRVPDCLDKSDEENCPPVACRTDEWTCGDGSCVPRQARCNGQYDCPDNTDEERCPIVCGSGQWTCEDGSCVAEFVVCDGYNDCPDLSDEQNCPTTCRPGEWTCLDGACLPKEVRCDGYPQCLDRSDEENCPAKCSSEEWTCGDGSCILKQRRCDRHYDCRDGSDEAGCIEECQPWEWTCRDRTCLPNEVRCDGIHQCSDRSDEENCPLICGSGQWTCADGSCVSEDSRCNRQYDCPDYSDEDGCPAGCGPGEWTCVDGSCIPQSHHCNRVPDCLDKSDEENCPPVVCGSGQWTCADGSCVSEDSRCNRQYDCPDYSDEDGCPAECDRTQWTCRDRSCIPQEGRCDGRYDCPDYTDEYSCPNVCDTNQWTCGDESCVPQEARCDGQYDCPDYTDEQGCQEEWTCSDGSAVPKQARCDGRYDCPDFSDEDGCTPECRQGEWQCNDYYCIQESQRCDRIPQCPDYSDEVDCPACNSLTEWQCDYGQCIDRRLHCDGKQDCLNDNSDERMCTTACRPDEMRCDDGQCLVLSRRCNGIEECTRGEDERGCPCQPDEWRCPNGQCIPAAYRCDGHQDCSDGSDEDCGTDRVDCRENEFKCANGLCIEKAWRCDTVPDCDDGSDEEKCISCRPTEFECGDGSCIPEYNRCDGRYDCTDGSDERVNCADCGQNEFQCGNGDCIPFTQRCNGYAECRDRSDEQNCNSFWCSDGVRIDSSLVCNGNKDCSDGSDEAECNYGTDYLSLKTYPDNQNIQQSREVVFQCRDEGTIRAPVRWVREGNRPWPPGTTDNRGRLTMPNIQVEHTGTYYCEAQDVPPSTPGIRKSVFLQVTPYVVVTPSPTPACGIKEATCMNGQCVDKDKVCDGVFDCSDASDEMRCNPLGCEPNEFQCDNKRCVLKTWLCDSDDDCGDGSDERDCNTTSSDSHCRYNEFACHDRNQCVLKSFNCDGEVDCQDGTDELGCGKPTILRPPPRNKMVQVYETFTLTCLAIGTPVPIVVWRLNWGHVPDRCEMTSDNGEGTLVCPRAQATDQGAYSCEALNSMGSVFAQPDCIVQVKGGSPVCQPPQFNAAAVTSQDCLTCFCFGATDQCHSADRFITQLPPPSSDSFSLDSVNLDALNGNYVIRTDVYSIPPRYVKPQSANAVQLSVDRTKLNVPTDLLVFFSLPDSHKGQQLSAFGGYLRYKIQYFITRSGKTISGPDVIMMGNGLTLMHIHDGKFLPEIINQVDVKFQSGQWFKTVVFDGQAVQPHEPASREEIMMVLENMELLLIRALYSDGSYVNATLSDVQLDTAVIPGSEQGRAVLVEECNCPQGYMGLSCQDCAPNYRRVQVGPWLGECVQDIECGPQEYGDPVKGIPCQPCPCPLSTPTNQFSTSCYLDTDSRVTCNCRQGYQGRRCEVCASGYEGQPNVPGDSCRPAPPSCEWYEFICGDMSRCIHKDKRCDRIHDCPDGSDEDYCEPVTCMTTFTCSDGSVHPWSRRCDGIKDCKDYEDERNCDVCFNSGHKCSDQQCVHFERICDGHPDCNDQSDELPQNCLDKLPCDHIHQWTCADPTRKCINRRRHCDGFYDCPDNSDERYCNCTCDESFNFRCNDGACLDSSVRCDLKYDCSDGSDELSCYCDLNTQFTCGDGTCIDRNRICDGYIDCRDASDETLECHPVCDPINMHQCGDGTCVDIRRVCDGQFDCRDYSDEPSSCSPVCNLQYEFTCGNNDCIDAKLVCNGYNDCRDGTDEYYCSQCNNGEFQCDDGSCISRQQLCDGTPDCRDQSDESERGGCCVPPYFFQCFDGSCIDVRQVCNRYPDCRDGSDEYDCSSECDPTGSYSREPDANTGRCQCKKFVTGPKCDQCQPNSFYLNENNRDGCIECFCMGITRECTSSNWYRQQESVSFTNDRQGFELVDKFQHNTISNDIFVDSDRQELVFSEFSRLGQEVYYWKLPRRFLGNKISSYGGNLTYSLRYVPAPGGQSSANSACAVEIFGNDITLKHYSKRELSAARQETVSVPLNELEWERQDGQKANREHFLMVLADLEYILIKATYTTNSEEVGLKEVILDYAEPRNTGQVRAFAVEMCECPVGYQGLSCEDCAIGYTRSLSGLHLGTCERCNCNGHSEECDPETGVCSNCRDNTAGDFCDECAPGFNEDSSGRCYHQDGEGDCNCDQRGVISCDRGVCRCKANVQRGNCDACQPGFFHLSSGNPEGCLQCWCSGVSAQCFSSNFYRTQLPMQLLVDHGFTFTNRLRTNTIRDGFDINVANNEISFADFANLNERESYYWSLPQMFTGNRLPSYGGNLTITQRYQEHPGGNTYSYPDIIIKSSGDREFIWMSPRTLPQNIEYTYVVHLTEDSFTMNQRPASRSQFLNALSSVDAILIRASISDRMHATFLRDVIMDTAVPSQTGQPRALEVEQCQCPKEYSGLSCQQCKPGHYRDSATNRCVQCPCHGHEESCAQLADGRIRCDCLPGYYGPDCNGSGLMLELRPTKVLFNRHSSEVYENFTCLYYSYEPLRIAFTREPTLVEDGVPMALTDTQAPHSTEEYTNGAKHFAVLRLLNGHKTVTCRVYDADNMEVAQMVSQIMYVSQKRRSYSPPVPDGQPFITVTISEPRVTVAAVGSTVQFQCSARSLSATQNLVSVTWNKAGGELPYGRASDNRRGLLVISRVQVTDGGTYICAATDGLGRVVTQNATLTVGAGGRPRVTIEERREELEVIIGGTLSVRCSATGSPHPQVVWTYGSNREQLPVNVFQQNGVLRMQNVLPSSSGEYFCTATNAGGSDYARIIINVVTADSILTPTGRPIIIVQVPKEVEVWSGETVRVTCSTGSPGSLRIEWSRLARQLPSQAVIESGELQIPDARPADSGTYICRITDERTNSFEESITQITITANIPTVQIRPDRQTINQGSTAELHCIVSGDPAPVITWSKVNEEFGSGVIADGNILRITNAVVNDRGMYICAAENNGGTAQAAAIVEVDRREPPVIEIYPEVKQTIVIGASALFQCHLTAGIPNPVVRWARTDRRPLTPNTETLNGGVLRFNQVQGDEEGSYTCTAENAAGTVTAVAILEIQSLPVITIRPGPSPHSIRIGERVRFECSVQGDPAPSVSWQKLQVNFPSNIPSQSVSPGVAVYEIASVTRADEGTYQCTARNSAGMSEERIQLTIEDILPGNRPAETLPEQPTRPDDSSTIFVPVGGSYDFSCFNRGPDADNTRFIFERSDGRPLPVGARIENNVLHLNNADESASGEYQCVGVDRLTGRILFTIYSQIEVLAPPRISLDPARQVVRPGEIVRIRCSATGPQPITINWSKESGYMPPSVIINGGEMMFRGIKTSDAGRYICEAINSAGTTRAVAEVIVNATKFEDNPEVHLQNPTKNPSSNFGGIGVTEDLFFDNIDGDDIDPSSAPAEGYFLSVQEEVMCKFLCQDHSLCLTPSQMCDGNPDCPDGSDEQDCLFDNLMATCPDSPCGNKVCIPQHKICDDIPDCNDAADEKNCHDNIFDLTKCSDFFKCGDGSCYYFYLNCDGQCDCNDCKDEKVCFRRRRHITHEEPLLAAFQQNMVMYVGQTAELRCEASGINPSDVRWTRMRGRLPPGAIEHGNLLRLPYVQPEDSGMYQCEAITPSGYRSSDVITLTVTRLESVEVKIRPSRSNVRIGDDVEFTCEVRGGSDAALSWSRMNSGLPSNAQPWNNVLRIFNVQPDNGGVYRCTVTTANGVFEGSYALAIQDIISSPVNGHHPRSVETRSVAFGLGIVMECRVSLSPPVSFTWNKQEGELPVKARIQEAVLDIPEVHTEDAGLYICTASNEERSTDIPTLLLVTGVVPRFEESSYLSLPTLPRAYLVFDLEISFKPESADGLILYNSQRAGREDGDFVSFGMSGGHAEFRFDVGSGPSIIRSRYPLEINQWHTVKLSRDRKEGKMIVDNSKPVHGLSEGHFIGLDLVELMYLGGVPDFSRIHEQTGFSSGFRGCISRLVISNTVTVDLMRDTRNKVRVTSCETCAGNPCQNNGVCQEAYTEMGHKCICPAGFSGGLCEDTGESCYPGVCGTGRCVNKPGGFECYCPFGKLGQRCEQDITIHEPAFGDEAYIAYPTPRALRRFSVDMNFKPENLDDGVLMYCAQKESGEGDFASLAIRNKRLEFRFNTGSGTATIQSEPLQQGQWIEARANRTDRLGSLMVNENPMQNGESPGSNRGLNLVTPLFIGGIDHSRIAISPEVGVKRGFTGCVSEIKLMDQDVRLAEALVDSANVGQCGGSSSVCSRNPCRNNGHCTDDSSTSHGYVCKCQEGYSGRDCEVEPGVCTMVQPCRNGGVCIGSGNDYSCRCPLGFAGHHCEHSVEIEGSASFSSDSWVEFDQSLLPQEGGAPQKVTFEFSTLKPEGLLFWYGQESNVSGRGQDFISVALRGGYVELSYELGTGPAVVRSSSQVNDGERHTLIVRRTGREGYLKLDRSSPETGESPGVLHMLNAKGNIYIGGVPDFQVMTDGAHTSGFEGCIHRLIIGEETVVNFMDLALSGINVTPCPSSRTTGNMHVTNSFQERDFTNGRNYNRRTVISRKKTVHTSRKNIHG